MNMASYIVARIGLILAFLLAGPLGKGSVNQVSLAGQPPHPSFLDHLNGVPPIGLHQFRSTKSLSATEIVPWSKLVFQSYRDFNWEIYLAEGDGSNPVRLTNNLAEDVLPRLNRGCTRIVFTSRRDSPEYEIYTMNIDGTNLMRLTSNAAADAMPAWSPDGNRIIFQSDRDGQTEIYIMNSDGSGQTRLTWNGGFDGQPVWSPDGNRIAFTSDRSGSYRIWVMNFDGSGQKQLSDQALSEFPAWSPDSSQVAYDSDADEDGYQELWVMNADGSNQHQVYNPPEPRTDAWVRSWSPDGRYIGFSRVRWDYVGGQWILIEFYLDALEVETGSIVNLSSLGDDMHPDWQPTDNLPPHSVVASLPPFSHPQVQVIWDGQDAGGSGMKAYDVQVRDTVSGAWVDWLVGTTQKSATFTGVAGHTYYFRSRAFDNAQNYEPWPGGDGDTSTTFYTWKATGTVMTNRDVPVSAASITTTPASFIGNSSLLDGSYTVFVAENSAEYEILVEKSGYGSLPPAYFSTGSDVVFNAVLPPVDNQVQDWGFESGSLVGAGWQVRGEISPTLTNQVHHTGHFAVSLGSQVFSRQNGVSLITNKSRILQAINIPEAIATPTLSFFYQLKGLPAPYSAWLDVQVEDGIRATTIFSSTSVTVDWTHRSIDLTPWSGKAITLTFVLNQAPGQPVAWAYLDEVSIGSAYPDLWVNIKSMKRAAIPGETVNYVITYGNRGGVSASGVHLVDTLPAGLEFVSASLPPTVDGQILTWDVGEMEAVSGPFTLYLTARISASAPGGSLVVNLVEIQTDSTEVDTLNNNAGVSVFVGRWLYFPLLTKNHYD